MSPTFVCGMGTPWTPWTPYHPPSPVVYEPPRCEHCFCIEETVRPVEQPKHLLCCKCGTRMAEKFVQAWFKILGEVSDEVRE